jgi:hypothetical protein
LLPEDELAFKGELGSQIQSSEIVAVSAELELTAEAEAAALAAAEAEAPAVAPAAAPDDELLELEVLELELDPEEDEFEFAALEELPEALELFLLQLVGVCFFSVNFFSTLLSLFWIFLRIE